MQVFKASLDNFSKIAVLITLLIIGFIVFRYTNGGIFFSPLEHPFPAFSLYLGIIVYCSTYFFRPISYGVTPSIIQINRPLIPFKINRTEISKCAVVSIEEMSGTIRTFGNGGLFGYTGYFRNAKFGSMRWFATQRKNYVLIEKTDGKKIVITPDEPEEFISSLK